MYDIKEFREGLRKTLKKYPDDITFNKEQLIELCSAVMEGVIESGKLSD